MGGGVGARQGSRRQRAGSRNKELPTPTGYVLGDLLGRALRTRFPASLLLKHDFGGRLLIPVRLREQVGAHLVLPLL